MDDQIYDKKILDLLKKGKKKELLQYDDIINEFIYLIYNGNIDEYLSETETAFVVYTKLITQMIISIESNKKFINDNIEYVLTFLDKMNEDASFIDLSSSGICVLCFEKPIKNSVLLSNIEEYLVKSKDGCIMYIIIPTCRVSNKEIKNIFKLIFNSN